MNFFIYIFLVPYFSLFAHQQEDLPEPYQSLELLPFDPHGWFENQKPMEQAINNNYVKVVIEVGSWLGKSTRYIASLLPLEGKVYAVDHWKGSAENQSGETGWHRALPYLYQQFLSNIIHAGLANKIIPIKMASVEAANVLCHPPYNVTADLIYIDASHDTDSVYADLCAWYPYVQGHGILCGDDWESSPNVRTAVTRFAIERGLKIETSLYFWRLVE